MSPFLLHMVYCTGWYMEHIHICDSSLLLSRTQLSASGPDRICSPNTLVCYGELQVQNLLNSWSKFIKSPGALSRYKWACGAQQWLGGAASGMCYKPEVHFLSHELWARAIYDRRKCHHFYNTHKIILC